MIDHLLGRPSTSLKRLQILFIILIWSTILKVSDRNGPRNFTFLRRLNKFGKKFTPWQMIVSILTFIYAVKHLDSLLGFGAPEPLARMYSRPFYRVTWIVTALDAGFATAMNIQPKWLRDIASLLFSLYYLIYAQEADEKLRKFRAFCTVDMMRATWHKTTNPYIRAVTWFHRPNLGIAREILLPRPNIAPHNKRPTKAWLFYVGSEKSLREEQELVLDFPGGGFVCMTPQHHEERLRQLAKETRRPVLSVDYGKSPEFIYPYALEECFDVYRSLIESNGKIIGMGLSDSINNEEKSNGKKIFSNGNQIEDDKKIRIILCGDSAGGNLATSVMFKIIEYPQPFIKTAYSNLKNPANDGIGNGSSIDNDGFGAFPLPRPIAMLLAYPSLNFEFTAWMKPDHLRVLRVQSEVNLQSIKNETQHHHQQQQSLPKSSKSQKDSQGNEQDQGKSTKGLSPTRSLSASRSRSRSRRPSLSSPIALLSPKDERSRESVMIAAAAATSSQDSKKGKNSIDKSNNASSINSNSDSNRTGIERQKSYLSLAGQAQMHLFERARFAEADDQIEDSNFSSNLIETNKIPTNSNEPNPDQSQLSSESGSETSRTWLGRIEVDEVDRTIDSLNDPDFEQDLKAQNEVEKAQLALSKAREIADELAKKRGKGKTGIVKTRLTMTSMSAYYSDRILTQSMMRAMAILYIGGRRQPSFDEDYLLSPIVAPIRLLSELPPVLFICGEKDPICDDTVVMAGRIREAKLSKQLDLKKRREGFNNRFGESLRLSSSNDSRVFERDPIEDEEPEDWVQMRILEGWSHGYLQMSSLLPESKQVISFLASWIRETFEDSEERLKELEEEKKGKNGKERKENAGVGNQKNRNNISIGQVKKEESKIGNKVKDQNENETSTNKKSSRTSNGKSIPPSSSNRSDVDEDEDEPLSFKTRRSPTQKHIEMSSNSNSPISASPSSSSTIQSKNTKSIEGSSQQNNQSSISKQEGEKDSQSLDPLSSYSSPIQSSTITKLRDHSRSRPRPSSFSKIESRQNSSSIVQQTSTSNSSSKKSDNIKLDSSNHLNSIDLNSSDEEQSSNLLSIPSSPTFKRRLSLDSSNNNERMNNSRGGGGNNDSLDHQYKRLLVEENTLLQRRRFGVANELGQSSSAVDSDDEDVDVEDDADDGEDERSGGNWGERSIERIQDQRRD